MNKVKFWGSSDNLIIIDGDFDWCDEYSEFAATDKLHSGFIIESISEKARCLIQPVLTNNDCWSFAFGIVVEDDEPASEWMPNIGIEHTYSTNLTLELPSDARLIWLKNKQYVEGYEEG